MAVESRRDPGLAYRSPTRNFAETIRPQYQSSSLYRDAIADRINKTIAQGRKTSATPRNRFEREPEPMTLKRPVTKKSYSPLPLKTYSQPSPRIQAPQSSLASRLGSQLSQSLTSRFTRELTESFSKLELVRNDLLRKLEAQRQVLYRLQSSGYESTLHVEQAIALAISERDKLTQAIYEVEVEIQRVRGSLLDLDHRVSIEVDDVAALAKEWRERLANAEYQAHRERKDECEHLHQQEVMIGKLEVELEEQLLHSKENF